MSWQDELELEVRDILSRNHERVVPVTRSEAILIATMVDVLSEIPEWVSGDFPMDSALGRMNDVFIRVLEPR